MRVLIVESCHELGELWKRHLERLGKTVDLVSGEEEAIAYLSENATSMIVVDLVLEDGGALTVSDFANYRHPNARVIFVTDTTFFSDGSISIMQATHAPLFRRGPGPTTWRRWLIIMRQAKA